MKKNYLWSLLAVVLTCVLTASSCHDDPEPEPELTVNKTSLSFEIMGGSLSFNVSSNVSWSISTEGDWFEVNDDSGKDGTTSVTVTAQENTKFESQTGKITVTSSRGNITRVISLSQKGKERQLKVSSNELSFEPEGGQKTFTITSNLDWEISGASDWLEVSPTSGSGDASITITAKPNNSGSRNATVLVKDKEGKASSVSITIKQNEIGLSVSPTSASLLSHQGAPQEVLRFCMLLRLELSNRQMAVIYHIAEKSVKQKAYLYKEQLAGIPADMSLRAYVTSQRFRS